MLPHLLRKGCLAVGVLLGPLVLPGDVQAAKTLPVVPKLELALTLLNSAQGSGLAQAAAAVEDAIMALGGPSTSRKLPSPPGGLYVLYNRLQVKTAQHLLKNAEKQLKSSMSMGAAQALTDVQNALRDVENFLLQPWIF
jgi:hypothetical protein